jgi:hypothetical protein
MGLMTRRDFENYFSLFEIMMSTIQPPDLIIYLRASIPHTRKAHSATWKKLRGQHESGLSKAVEPAL